MHLLIGCGSNSNRILIYTDKLISNVYIEKFREESYGVGGDVYSVYLTDSIRFRKFVCKYYDSQSFNTRIIGDSIYIFRFEDSYIDSNNKKIDKKLINIFGFDYIMLKNEGKFEK